MRLKLKFYFFYRAKLAEHGVIFSQRLNLSRSQGQLGLIFVRNWWGRLFFTRVTERYAGGTRRRRRLWCIRRRVFRAFVRYSSSPHPHREKRSPFFPPTFQTKMNFYYSPTVARIKTRSPERIKRNDKIKNMHFFFLIIIIHNEKKPRVAFWRARRVVRFFLRWRR